MKNKILHLLSFLTIMLYSVAGYAQSTNETAFEKMIRDLSAGKTKEVIDTYFTFDGPRLWIIFASMLIAVNLVKLAGDLGKELGGANLGGSVGNSSLGLIAAGTGFVVGNASKAAGRGIKKLGEKLQDNSSSQPPAQQQTQSAGSRDYEPQQQPQQQQDNTNGITANQNNTMPDNPTNYDSNNASPIAGNEEDNNNTTATGIATGLTTAAVTNALKNEIKNTGVVSGIVPPTDTTETADDANANKDDNAHDPKRPEMPGRSASRSLASQPSPDTDTSESDAVKEDLRRELAAGTTLEEKIEQHVSPVRQTADTALAEARKDKTS